MTELNEAGETVKKEAAHVADQGVKAGHTFWQGIFMRGWKPKAIIGVIAVVFLIAWYHGGF
jgi:hypothetical protein